MRHLYFASIKLMRDVNDAKASAVYLICEIGFGPRPVTLEQDQAILMACPLENTLDANDLEIEKQNKRVF